MRLKSLVRCRMSLAWLSAALIALGQTASATATDYAWNNAGTDWNVAGNWNPAGPPGPGDLAIFDALTTSNFNTSLSSALSINGLKIIDPGAAIGIGGSPLTLGGGGIDMAAATQDLTIGANVVVGAGQSWAAGSRLLTVNGNVSIDSALALTSGTVTFNGTNNGAGGVNINGATVQIGNSGVFGTGALTLTSGTIQASGGLRSVTNNVTVAGNITVGGSDGLNFNTGTMDLGGATRTFTITNSATTIFGGVISNGGLTKAGTGTLDLTAVNTFTDGTTVQDGTLLLRLGDNRLPTASAVVLGGSGGTSGVLRLGSGSMASNQQLVSLTTAVGSGSANAVVGGATATSTLTVRPATGTTVVFAGFLGGAGTNQNNLGLTINGATNSNFELTGTGNNTYTGPTLLSRGNLRLNKSGGNAVGGNLTVTPAGGMTGGWTVVWLASNQIADTATLALNGTNGNGASAINMGGFSETIAALSIQNNQGSSTQTVAIGTGTLTVNGNISIAGTSSNATNVTISSSGAGSLNLGGTTRTVNVTTNTPSVISAVLTNGGLTKTGNSVLVLSGASTYTGPTTVSNGALRIGAASVAGVSGPLGLNSDVTLANTAGVVLDLTNNNTGNFNTQIGSLTGGGASGGNITLGSATLTVAGSTSPAAYAGVISGTGGLTRSGAGTLTLSATNTYTGVTTVSGGTLALSGNGSFASSPTIDVQTTATLDVSGVTGGANFDAGTTRFTFQNGQTLKGNGSVNGVAQFAAGSVLAPGASAGRLTFNNGLALTSGSTFKVELGGAAVTDYDQLLINAGSINLGNATLDLSLINGFTPGTSNTFGIIRNVPNNAIIGTFGNTPLNTYTFLDGSTISVSYSGSFDGVNFLTTGGNDVVLHNFQPVPEPGGVLLLCAAAATGAVWFRRRRDRKTI